MPLLRSTRVDQRINSTVLCEIINVDERSSSYFTTRFHISHHIHFLFKLYMYTQYGGIQVDTPVIIHEFKFHMPLYRYWFIMQALALTHVQSCQGHRFIVSCRTRVQSRHVNNFLLYTNIWIRVQLCHSIKLCTPKYVIDIYSPVVATFTLL